MTGTIRAAAVAAAALLGAHAAAAQERPVSPVPIAPARWDLAGHVGWLGSNKTGIGDEWNDWYDAASFGVAAGHYFTPHLKVEAQAAASRQGRIYSQEIIQVPGAAFPTFRSREHFFAAQSLSAGVSHQFFEEPVVSSVRGRRTGDGARNAPHRYSAAVHFRSSRACHTARPARGPACSCGDRADPRELGGAALPRRRFQVVRHRTRLHTQ